MSTAGQPIGIDPQSVGIQYRSGYIPPSEHSFDHQSNATHSTHTLLRPAYPPPGTDAEKGRSYGSRPTASQHSSWAPLKQFEESYEHFDSRNASNPHLVRAEGDAGADPVSKFYYYLLSVSIVTRWFLFIIPILGVIWIPGILGQTRFPDANIWQVRLLWWSIWLSVVWLGWWASLAVCAIVPRIARWTIGVVAVGSRKYIEWLKVLHRYAALFVWTLVVWIAWKPLLSNNYFGTDNDSGANALSILGKLLFAFFLCSAILLFEKLSIQWIADKFHQRSYADRIADQKKAVDTLVVLYINSKNLARADTLDDPVTRKPLKRNLFKRTRERVRNVATASTTIFGNVVSEIAGSSVLQPNSPMAIVQTALQSANKSRLLARRLFYSFVKANRRNVLVAEDIRPFFKSDDAADAAFAVIDKDSNGDVDRDELELVVVDIHREQLAIEHSLQDLDSAVSRLDNILVSLTTIISLLIIAVALQAGLATLVTGAGTLILGLSWLIGGSAQEVLTSIIFLFVKHPFDVSDRIIVNGKDTYTVKEIHLLSTVFVDGQGCVIQAPNIVLNAAYIQNFRRSNLMSEPYVYNVAYGTTYAQLQELRDRMMVFLKDSSRDFLAVFDVNVVDMPDQGKMVLTSDIKYKSNWQQGAIKTQRRNKWMCALKDALLASKIYGPSGDPNAVVAPTKYTVVPFERVEADERAAASAAAEAEATSPNMPAGGWKLHDKHSALVGSGSDVFNEADDLRRTNPRRGGDIPPVPAIPSGAVDQGTSTAIPSAFRQAPPIQRLPPQDNIEMNRI